jgi:hypothetical protein
LTLPPLGRNASLAQKRREKEALSRDGKSCKLIMEVFINFSV